MSSLSARAGPYCPYLIHRFIFEALLRGGCSDSFSARAGLYCPYLIHRFIFQALLRGYGAGQIFTNIAWQGPNFVVWGLTVNISSTDSYLKLYCGAGEVTVLACAGPYHPYLIHRFIDLKLSRVKKMVSSIEQVNPYSFDGTFTEQVDQSVRYVHSCL